MQITVDVPDDSQLAKDLASWKNGDEYDLRVRQREQMAFDGISGAPAEPEEEAEDEEWSNEAKTPPMPKARGKTEMPPALMIVMGKRK